MSRRLDQLARAHDALAPTYDASLANNPVAVWMRQKLWSHYARAFPPGARLLDFAAGTGIDALHLAEEGAQVVALDVSPGMTACLQENAARQGLNVDARVWPAERLGELGLERFDGALCAFAGLNTIDDLRQLSVDLARLLKPGGRVVLHALNSFCVWETANRLLHGRRPGPRQERTCIGDQLIQHRFFDPLVLWREAFAPEFRRREVYALSVIAAPTWVRRLGSLGPLVLRLDGMVGHALPRAGDFFVLDLEKR
jgi:SAM-dependent methyltransferase